jgi:hypothetical protein
VLLWSSLVYAVTTVWALSTRVRLVGLILRGLGALPLVGPRLRTDPARVAAVEDAVIETLALRPAVLAQILPLECVAQAILVSEIYWTIHSMGVPIDAWKAIEVEVLTKAANVVQLVGVTEAGYSIIFSWLGMSAAVGFALSLVKLLRSLAAAGLGLAILKAASASRSVIALFAVKAA